MPTTIARLSVPYGDAGGWPWFHLMMMKAGVPIPVHRDGPNVYNPLHEDDYVAHLPKPPRAREHARDDAQLGWAASPRASRTGPPGSASSRASTPQLEPTDRALGSLELDLTRMHAALGRTSVGLARRHPPHGARRATPELLRGAHGS